MYMYDAAQHSILSCRPGPALPYGMPYATCSLTLDKNNCKIQLPMSSLGFNLLKNCKITQILLFLVKGYILSSC
mgnify:FL=1